ncbi:hypothetical protein CDCA_CDCA18G4581 [Cyanidium caldarium]|uniref:DUF7875 domain-containing protein n=1 Tax=Cyanidium caldarium TaxID=2771 RepID=A0AAV9J2M8_CYACA|nr:hypothetical protein CDCA_CDCA18G4581 [Cyanidium caldarium]
MTATETPSGERPNIMRPRSPRCDDIVRQISIWSALCWAVAGWPMATWYYTPPRATLARIARFSLCTSVTAAGLTALWIRYTDPSCSEENVAEYGTTRYADR